MLGYIPGNRSGTKREMSVHVLRAVPETSVRAERRRVVRTSSWCAPHAQIR